MDNLLRDIHFEQEYIDDLLIASLDLISQKQHMRAVLKRLNEGVVNTHQNMFSVFKIWSFSGAQPGQSDGSARNGHNTKITVDFEALGNMQKEEQELRNLITLKSSSLKLRQLSAPNEIISIYRDTTKAMLRSFALKNTQKLGRMSLVNPASAASYNREIAQVEKAKLLADARASPQSTLLRQINDDLSNKENNRRSHLQNIVHQCQLEIEKVESVRYRRSINENTME
ncbi:hypothetical protein Smp_154080 [Schistosoma mansoni]|uniref:hypothetical protein n=1 Tax=Schistosoma mansoni TaxID=6183 RepID=UPI0001A643D3|nr:hypothetical protein Smp_154080 [Schistosoma mansoni]|eukprot:XP_018653190.1 hypothetical protein Smp_154080 [Schistosoma mansoni]